MSQNSPKLSRRLLLGGAVAAPAAGLALPAAARPASDAAGPVSAGVGQAKDLSAELLDQWAGAGGAHPLIPDISHAGYRGGERPRRARVVARVTDFGAHPGSTADAAPAFNADEGAAAHDRVGWPVHPVRDAAVAGADRGGAW
ncbi:hypothetical protein ACFPJ1_38115 [Kribbella qitaiheensis]|uniref:hypothetical protein n=1 Tax=Kribbella qitaiheensis TaxID=1544730 RepID=UPI0036105125